MAIDSIAPATTMDRSSTVSASDSDTSGGGGDGEPRPAGEEKKGEPTKPGVVCLKKLLWKAPPDSFSEKEEVNQAPPDYLTLSLTPSSAMAAAAYRRRNRQVEVSLAHVDAPRGYLSLSLTPSDKPKRRRGRDVSGGGGSVLLTDASSVASSAGEEEGALVVVADKLPPAAAAAKCLPPKKRKLAAAGVYQETVGTKQASSSLCLELAIVNDHDGVSRTSSMPPGDGETGSPATMASHSHPIDAVPLQAVCVHGGVSRPFRLSGCAGKITANKTAAPPEPAWIRETLRLAAEHQLTFIASKRVQHSDVDTQQSRFMIPRGETNERLRPLLDADERDAAGMHEAWERPKHEHGGDGERPRVQGKAHGGLVVPVVINRAGNRMDARLTRWDSTGSTVLKFGNYKSFVNDSGLKKDDNIEIWAFRKDGGLHLVIAKIDGETTAAPPEAGGQQVA